MSKLLFNGILVVSFALTSTVFGAANRGTVEAVVGNPFGVARVTVPFPARDVGGVLGSSAYGADEPTGRVLYPAFNQGFLRRLLGTGAPPPASLTVLILFRGQQPFDVTIRTPSPQVVHIVPSAASRSYARLLRQWWRYYNMAANEQAARGDYPPIVETYLTSMLARRLNLSPPLLVQLQQEAEQTSPTKETLKLLAGAEKLRIETLRATSLGAEMDTEPARQPIPTDIAWRQPVPPPAPADTAIEPLAMHVPEECFYVRFGQFTNYLWLNQLLNDYGGDIGSMITARSLPTGLNRRVERQLCLKQSALAELLGPTVIADVAIIGRDTYTREGAAIGIMFQARNALLGTDLMRQQNEALFAEKANGATRQTVQIAGHAVSFVSTPDNRLRSFHAVDGDFHLVTTSRAIVERFYAVGQGGGSLGAHPEFRHARTVFPLKRDDTVFVFFSTPFLQGLFGPVYQIELARRMQAVTDIELVHLARLAANGERVPAETIDHLVDAELLPPQFGRRPDGSGPILTDDVVTNSLRGERGTFLPIPDVPLRGVTTRERTWYEQRANFYAEKWQQLDPIMIAVHRYALDEKGRERLMIDANISPIDEAKYSFLAALLGPATTKRVVPPENNIVTVQAALRGGVLLPNVPPHIMFLGIEDHAPLTDYQTDSVLQALQIIRAIPGHLGAWPKPGFLDALPFNLGGSEADANGFSRLLFGVMRWQGQGFSVISLDREILERTSRALHIVETTDPTQIQVHAGDLSQAKFARWIDTMIYERARQTSVGNAKFLNLLTQQLSAPRADALRIAQNLFKAKMQCTLGGQYQLDNKSATPLWRSTAWPQESRYRLPDDYQSPLLGWFRGLDASLLKDNGRLIMHAQIDMQRKEGESPASLPLLDLFGGSKKP